MTHEEKMELAIKMGLTWVPKPYSIEALTRAVGQVLESSRDG